MYYINNFIFTTYNVLWLYLVAENTRPTLIKNKKMENKKLTLNESENDNKLKPLLYEVILTILFFPLLIMLDMMGMDVFSDDD